MQRSAIVHKIHDLTQVLQCSPEQKKQIASAAVELSSNYLKRLSSNDDRYVVDIALSSVYLSSNQVGCKVSLQDVSKQTGHSLFSWTRIVKDMQKKVR